VSVEEIDAAAGMLRTNVGNVRGEIINAIPAHRAGEIVTASALNNIGARWAGVDVLTYESTVAPGIHVIGDSSATTQPKAGHIANQQAKVCADAIARLLRGEAVDQAPVTNSACYSTVTMNTASWLTVVFAYDAATRSMKAVPASSGEGERATAENFRDMDKWFRSLMADTFG
jgi:NADPH-dependent 2,4-dienoyl-CoA reductase/sulfur reductase-like enzyme